MFFSISSLWCKFLEKVCNEVVTAGTDCFTKSISVKRFYYNSAFDRCESFEYFGCSGNNNNFLTREQCENSCNRGEQNGRFSIILLFWLYNLLQIAKKLKFRGNPSQPTPNQISILSIYH